MKMAMISSNGLPATDHEDSIRIRATWFFAFGLEWGLIGVWIGSTCDWLVRSVALAWVFHRGRWMKIE